MSKGRGSAVQKGAREARSLTAQIESLKESSIQLLMAQRAVARETLAL
jgi:hypothetical protein